MYAYVLFCGPSISITPAYETRQTRAAQQGRDERWGKAAAMHTYMYTTPLQQQQQYCFSAPHKSMGHRCAVCVGVVLDDVATLTKK